MDANSRKPRSRWRIILAILVALVLALALLYNYHQGMMNEQDIYEAILFVIIGTGIGLIVND